MTDLEKEETEKLDTRLESIRQREVGKIFKSKGNPSEKSNWELTIASKNLVPYRKFP